MYIRILDDSVFINRNSVNNLTYNKEDYAKSECSDDTDCTLTDDEEFLYEEDMPQSSAGGKNAFRVSRHKKLELHSAGVRNVPTKTKVNGVRTQSESLTQNGSNSVLPSARTFSGSDIGTESNVLRKVASLTLDRATIDKKLTKPKFVPEKLDFKIYEKFEGQMLVNWFVSTFDEEHSMKNIIGSTELKLLAAQFCTNLLAAGVVRQIEDINAPIQTIFRPDLMYYWTHTESSVTLPNTPGKLSPTAWPPNYFAGVPLSKNQFPFTENGNEYGTNNNAESTLKYLNNEETIELHGYQHRIEQLQTEIDKLQTLSDIEDLSKNGETEIHTSVDERKNSDKCTSPLSYITYLNADTQTDPVDYLHYMKSKKLNNASQTSPELLHCLIPCSMGITADDDCIKIYDNKTKVITCPPRHHPFPIIENSLHISLFNTKDEVEISNTLCSTPLNSVNKKFPLPKISTLEIDNASRIAVSPPLPPVVGKAPPPPPPPPPVFGKIAPCPPPPPPPPAAVGPTPTIFGAPPPAPPPPPPPILGNHSATFYLLKRGDHSGPHPPSSIGNCGPPPPPPPGAPPPPPLFNKGPTPFPPPPVGGWNQTTAAIVPALRKIPVIPRSAMKPLYWTRIQILSAVFENTPEDTVEEKINITAEPLWDNLTEEEFDESEFVDLFARNVSAPVKAKKKIDEKITKAKVVKSLDSKRSQNIGIFITSQHLDIKDVENAVYNFDTTLLDLEILQQVYELRGTSEELNKIITQEVSSNDLRLDKPEQFLLDLSRINLFSERIFCFMFKATFAADLDVVHTRSNLLLTTIEKLMKSDSIKKILGLILAFGNYMNGGNRQRGQADGFGLEILPKLKDVKSKDSSITLLHFIVSKYIKKFEGADAGTDKVKLPIPDPYSVEKSSNVQFEELQKDLINLDTNLQVCERRSQQVIKDSDCDHLHPFQERMTEFIQEARKDLDRENLNLKECKKQFDKVKKYFQFNGKGKDVTPSEFFGVWAPFCNDFMQIWQKEQLKIVKTRIKEAEDAAKRIKEGKKEITLKGKEEGEDAGKHIKEGKKKITLKGTEEGGLKAKLKARMRH